MPFKGAKLSDQDIAGHRRVDQGPAFRIRARAAQKAPVTIGPLGIFKHTQASGPWPSPRKSRRGFAIRSMPSVAVAQEKHGLKPVPEASRRVLSAPRLFWIFTGLPPATRRDEGVSFLADPFGPTPTRKSVDKLLARPAVRRTLGAATGWMSGATAIGTAGASRNQVRYSQRHIWRWARLDRGIAQPPTRATIA